MMQVVGSGCPQSKRRGWENTTSACTTPQIQIPETNGSVTGIPSRIPPPRRAKGTAALPLPRQPTSGASSAVTSCPVAPTSSLVSCSGGTPQQDRKCGPKVFPELLYEMLTAASALPATNTATAVAVEQPVQDKSNEKIAEDEAGDYVMTESNENSNPSMDIIAGFEHIISWQPHGRCFLIHKKAEFVRSIMPRFFHQTKLTSFQRQLNLYGFVRLTTGLDRGGYYHEMFLRGRPELCHRIHRQKIKGHGGKVVPNPNTEPNFYAMDICYDAAMSPNSGSSNEQESCVGLTVDAKDVGVKDAKGSKRMMDVLQTKEPMSQDAVLMAMDTETDINMIHEDTSPSDVVSMELMDIQGDLDDNGTVVLDLDDQIDKESLAQVECEMAMYDVVSMPTGITTMSDDSVFAGKQPPHIVTPHKNKQLLCPDNNVLTRSEENGPQSIPLLLETNSSNNSQWREGKCVLMPSVVQSWCASSATAWPMLDGQQDDSMDRDDAANHGSVMNFLQQQHSCPTAVEVLNEDNDLRDGDEVWYDEGHCFCFVDQPTPLLVTASGLSAGHGSGALATPTAAWVGSSSSLAPPPKVATRSISCDATVVVGHPSGDGGCDTMSTETTIGTSSSSSADYLNHHHPSMLFSSSSALFSCPTSAARLLQHQSLPLPPRPKKIVSSKRGRRRSVMGTTAAPTISRSRVTTTSVVTQRRGQQPYWDGRRASI